MNKSVTLLYFILLSACNILFSQQININDSVSAKSLIENNLAEGCIEFSNIKSEVNGDINNITSYGYFDKGDSSFPFDHGIVLTTGSANAAGNKKNTNALNDGEKNWGTDPDLETALGISGTLNATSIVFNFLSVSNQIQFNYILASEEYYGNFPCDYSDGFAFLIRKADSGEAFTNIAVIPGTSTQVNTNSIHQEILGFCDAKNEQYFDGYNVGDTNYNGRTNVLSASTKITPNVLYEIKLVIADYNDTNYDSAVFIEGNSFNSSVDLGDDIQTCASSEILNADIENPNAIYSWFFNNILIDNADQSSLTVTESGTYSVQIEIPYSSSTCTIEDHINVNLNNAEDINPISNYEICDDPSGDIIETFDLTTKNTSILDKIPSGNYNISYHYTLEDSKNNSNAITTSIKNKTSLETIYVRIRNTDTGCLRFTHFNLIVNLLPFATKPKDLEVCVDDFSDKNTTIDLSLVEDEIIGSQTDINITYYASPQDAETGLNKLPTLYSTTNGTGTIYARVENTNTTCFSTTNFNFIIHNTPEINTTDTHYLDACDKDYDGYAYFNLTKIIPEIISDQTDLTVTFHESLEDAQLNENAIVNDTNYQNIKFKEQTVYIRVENNITSCASFTTVELHVNLLLTGTENKVFEICDITNDKQESFDLPTVASGIIGDLNDIQIMFYETEEDRDNNINVLNNDIPYTVNSLETYLFITVTSPTCEEFDIVNLKLIPVEEFDSIGTVNYCDSDQDGFVPINLRTFDSAITYDKSDFSINYFLTEDDAQNNINNLGNSFKNTENPQVFFTRITNTVTGCFDTNTFKVQVLPAPNSSTPSPIIICNNNQETAATINLTIKASEIISNNTDRIISYYNNLNDAQNSNNPILNPSKITTASKTFYSRIENTVSGCYSTQPIKVIINSTPTFTSISNYVICNTDNTSFTNFKLNTKDSEILNGQLDKTVSYYLNEEDARNRINPIDKNNNFKNTTNPQILFTRLENKTDINCFNTSSFILEVGNTPLFNHPTDLFICDDISNDGIESIDLTAKTKEISTGITEPLEVTFYTTITDAENKANPISNTFTNTKNPQTIFTVIDNGNICKAITSFTINIIQIPEVKEQKPSITKCDTDYDGRIDFDLTASLFEILNVRQDNIEVSYFEAPNELEQNINPISNPNKYTNTSNPQTVYLKIANTISNCFVSIPLELNVNTPPEVNNITAYQACDYGTVNLNAIDNLLIENSSSFQISYFSSYDAAFYHQNELNKTYSYHNLSEILYAKTTNKTTSCFTISSFNLQINEIPIANKPNNLEACDDDFDSQLYFDLTQQTTSILGTQDASNFNITYHSSYEAAENNSPPLASNNYLAINNETLFARIENITTNCFSITNFNIIIHPRPILDIGDQYFCLENSPLFISANTNISTDSYLWSTGETTPEIEILKAGTYSVTVTTKNGCQTFEAFNAYISEQATIKTTEIIDFSDPNNITITVTGLGNYAYVIDQNKPQTNNQFTNVSIGPHTITIIDLNGCLERTKNVMVFDTPKFMTPNNDGYFDTWHITGVENLTDTFVYIYDRYGKLLKKLSHNSPGWDGTFRGVPMPAEDYWYLANVNYKGKQMQLKGHFALKR